MMIIKYLERIVIFLLCCLFSTVIIAQEKRLMYYNTHEAEILPDARAAFRDGDYERTVLLCTWHYIIVGNDDAEPLSERAERCKELLKEMETLQAAGMIKEAKEIASLLLSLNPADSYAKDLLDASDDSVSDMTQLSVPVVLDPLAQIQDKPVDQFGGDSLLVSSPYLQVGDLLTDNDGIDNYQEASNSQKKSERFPTCFLMKVGVSGFVFDDDKAIAPEGSIGLYDIGGSRFGVEVGAFSFPWLSDTSSPYPLGGFDASLLVRLTKGGYQRVGIGYISSSRKGKDVKGLCGRLGLVIMVKKHVCFEFGLKYYPRIYYNKQGGLFITMFPGNDNYGSGITQILNGGIAPMISFGFALN